MRYIAKKNKDKYTVTGIKEMETLDNARVEVLFASKDYDKKALEETIETYTKEKEQVIEKYDADLKDMKDILEAINQSK